MQLLDGLALVFAPGDQRVEVRCSCLAHPLLGMVTTPGYRSAETVPGHIIWITSRPVAGSGRRFVPCMFMGRGRLPWPTCPHCRRPHELGLDRLMRRVTGAMAAGQRSIALR